jgi:bisphosphoglycerate-independent phosphoglycerate mutase (AlkP superfamily)
MSNEDVNKLFAEVKDRAEKAEAKLKLISVLSDGVIAASEERSLKAEAALATYKEMLQREVEENNATDLRRQKAEARVKELEAALMEVMIQAGHHVGQRTQERVAKLLS